jgi:2-oxoglutarate ferredoxin oxidoreductase subunit alpha
LIPELNGGQLQMLIQAKYLRQTVGLHKMIGKPFIVEELVAKIQQLMG